MSSADDGPTFAERYPELVDRVPGADDDKPALGIAPIRVMNYATDLLEFLGDDEPLDDDSEWLVKGLIAAEVPNVIAGAPKATKSFLMWHLALAIASGTPAFGVYPVKRARVLVLEREDPQRECRRRIWRVARGMGLDPRTLGDWFRVNRDRAFYFDDAAHLADLRADLARWPAEVVFVDSLRTAHRGNENDSTDMAAVTGPWGDLCAQFKCAVVPLAHQRKTKEGDERLDPGQLIRGSSALQAFLRHYLTVTFDGKKKTSTVTAGGNMHGAPEPFSYALRDGVTEFGKNAVYVDHGGNVEEAKEASLERAVREALEEGPLSEVKLREAVGGDNNALSKVLRRMAKGELAPIFRASPRAPWRLREVGT